MFRIAHRDPCIVDEVKIFSEFFYRLSFERKWILGDQYRRIRAPFDLDRPPHVHKRSSARAHVVVRFVRFQVLILIVELHVPASHAFIGLIVVLHVIRAQPFVPEPQVHVSVRACHASRMALRPAGRQLCNSAFSGYFWRLGENRGATRETIDQRDQKQDRPKRGTFCTFVMKIFADHAICKNRLDSLAWFPGCLRSSKLLTGHKRKTATRGPSFARPNVHVTQ